MFFGLPGNRRRVHRRDDHHRCRALLLREVDQRLGVIGALAECFDDFGDPDLIEHPLAQLLAQPRVRRGKALAGRSTLNRLELTPPGASAKSRYKKIAARHKKLENFFVDMFPRQHAAPPKEIILDVDATDDPLHGRFFHGYHKRYCYLPLYIFRGEHLLCALLRPSNIDAAAGTVKQLDRIISRIREQWPQTRIIIRGDSGFCRDEIMSWCEANQVHFLLGLAKNERLKKILGRELHEAKELFQQSGQAARVFKDFTYQTRKSWSQQRRVVGKAEHLAKGSNSRFIVTSLSAEEVDARTLYEDQYCARGAMENCIKEQQLFLFADRTSAHTMRANQLRVWLSGVAYVLMMALRQNGLKNTPLENAQCDTIRLKLFKIGARVKISVRRVWLSLSSAYPWRALSRQVLINIQRNLPFYDPRADRPPPVPA